MLKLLTVSALVVVLAVAAAGCASTNKHPMLFCSQVGPGVLACVDAESLKGSDTSTDSETEKPTFDPKDGA